MFSFRSLKTWRTFYAAVLINQANIWRDSCYHRRRHVFETSIWLKTFFYSLDTFAIDGAELLLVDAAEEEESSGSLYALGRNFKVVQRRVVGDDLIRHHVRFHLESPIGSFAHDDFEKVSRHRHVLIANDFVFDVEFPVRFFVWQKERPSADVDVWVNLRFAPRMPLESVPRITIETASHLRRNVWQIKGLVEMSLMYFVIAGSGKMPPVIAWFLVVGIFRSKEGMNRLVSFKVALHSVNLRVVFDMGRREMLKHPVRWPRLSVVAEDVIVERANVV